MEFTLHSLEMIKLNEKDHMGFLKAVFSVRFYLAYNLSDLVPVMQ